MLPPPPPGMSPEPQSLRRLRLPVGIGRTASLCHSSACAASRSGGQVALLGNVPQPREVSLTETDVRRSHGRLGVPGNAEIRRKMV